MDKTLLALAFLMTFCAGGFVMSALMTWALCVDDWRPNAIRAAASLGLAAIMVWTA